MSVISAVQSCLSSSHEFTNHDAEHHLPSKALDEFRLKHWLVKTRGSVLECASPLALSSVSRPAESSTGVEHSRTLPRSSKAHC
jgi:hypothetical protein